MRTSHPRRRSSTALSIRALVLGATTAALLLLTTGAAHADPVSDVLDTVQGTLDDTVDTVQGTLDDTVDTVQGTVNDTVTNTVDTVQGTVGGSEHPGTDDPAPDPTTPEDPTSGGGATGSDGGHGHEATGSHSADQGSPSVVIAAGPPKLESTGGDGTAVDPSATDVGGGLSGSLTPPRGPAGPAWPGFGTTGGRIALSLLVAVIAVLVLFHAVALWLRMAGQPDR
jgi:hypothetical protein